jgi:hypothetical protein
MVYRPCKTANISPAALYRVAQRYHPTILADEVQVQSENVDFWLVIKAGHGEPRSAVIPTPWSQKYSTCFAPNYYRVSDEHLGRSLVVPL